MNIEVRALSPALLDDYLNFFDNVAFADHKEWSSCYCVHFHWNDRLEMEYKQYDAAGGNSFGRDCAIRFIQDGTIKGYLAYAGGSVTGWCNANDKTAYDGLARDKWPEIWEDADPTAKVKSVVCFVIAPAMRGRGIATALLNKVCADAAEQGYSCVEAYPYKQSADVYANYHGPIVLYKRYGFLMAKDLGDRAIVRKNL